MRGRGLPWGVFGSVNLWLRVHRCCKSEKLCEVAFERAHKCCESEKSCLCCTHTSSDLPYRRFTQAFTQKLQLLCLHTESTHGSVAGGLSGLEGGPVEGNTSHQASWRRQISVECILTAFYVCIPLYQSHTHTRALISCSKAYIHALCVCGHTHKHTKTHPPDRCLLSSCHPGAAPCQTPAL